MRCCSILSLALSIGLVQVIGLVQPIQADDWPQWLGPQRDSVWREQGVVQEISEDGLPVRWRVPVELGYSGPAVAQGRVYVTDYVKRSGESTNNPGGRDELEGDERVLCFAADTGRLLWKYEYDCPYRISYPGGPRCTPTVDAGKVYTLGAEGALACLDAESGRLIWRKELTEDYDVDTPIWGFAAHPLIDGDLLYCMAGGQGSAAVALNKHTGEQVWQALAGPRPGYCPPTLIEHRGRKQLLIWDPKSLNGLDPRSGEVDWSLRLQPSYGMSITAPRKSKDRLFVSGIGNVSVMLQLPNGQADVEPLWRGTPKTSVHCANSTPFFESDVIYGADCQLGALIAARADDGERLWETFQPTTGGTRRASHGTAFLVKHQDRFFIFSETGDLILARLSPEAYTELGRFHVLEPTNECFGRKVVWSHPAFAYKCMFARNDKQLVCVDLERISRSSGGS